jgi:hypothetical protein
MRSWKDDVANFWNDNPCGTKFSDLPIGSAEFFTAVEAHRYGLEPHILEMADFQSAKGLRVLELGCGLGTDGVQFTRHGATYTGLDLTANGTRLAKRHLDVEGESGTTVAATARICPSTMVRSISSTHMECFIIHQILREHSLKSTVF